MYVADPQRFAVQAESVCRNCRNPIEWRFVLGWIHVEGFFVCPLKPVDDKFFQAAPV